MRFPCHRVPQEGGPLVAGSALLMSGDREQRRPRQSYLVVAGKEHIERAEHLPLATARAVVPVTEERPDMSQFGGGGIGPARGALLFVPVEKIGQLRTRARDIAVRPLGVAQQRPDEPMLVIAFA